jgi:uncharacterized protein (DUF4415 family)
MASSPRNRKPSPGRADLKRLRLISEADIAATSPPELADLPADFWDQAAVVRPKKEAISLRLDADVLAWFKRHGPGYQSRINAVLRFLMHHAMRHPVTPRKRVRRSNDRRPAARR